MSRAPALFCLSLLFALPACGGCGDPPPPPDGDFDGNVIVGDAVPSPDAEPDAGEEDADSGELDAADAAEDGGDADAGEDAGDAADAEVDCDPPAVRAVTATVAVAEAALLQGMIIEIVGTATVTALACTDCADAGACTCTCTATTSIEGLVALIPSECFDSPGCAGNECTQVCRPPVLGVEQSFRGRLNVRNSAPGTGVELQLFSVSR
jgi:hypothetical protein